MKIDHSISIPLESLRDLLAQAGVVIPEEATLAIRQSKGIQTVEFRWPANGKEGVDASE